MLWVFGGEMKPRAVNILRMMNVKQDDADRIAGGLIRIENTSTSGKSFVKKALKLAKNEKEKYLIWYFIGMKLGMLSERGLVVPQAIWKKNMKKEKEKKEKDPSVQ